MKPYTVKSFGGLVNHGSKLFVGVDQSYSGFAITFLDEQGNYATRVAKAEGTGVVRLINLWKFLEDTFYEPGLEVDGYLEVDDVAMEGYAFGSQMANMLGELGGMVKFFFYDNFTIQPLLVPPTSLKKYVTGKGTGVQKNQMLLHIYKKWGVEFNDDNAADSYALARIAAKLANTQYEKEILEKLDGPKFRA